MISLRYEKWQADILPEHGMNTVRLCWDGEYILRDPAGETALETSCLHGTPLLLPPNRTEAGRFSFDGKDYQLPVNEAARGNHLHGYLRFQAFAVTEQSEKHVAAVYENKGDIFPFPFAVRAVFRLDDGGYRQCFAIRNTGQTPMPLTFGIHTNFAEKPFFRIPLERQWLVNDNYIPVGEPAQLSDRQKQYREGMYTDGQKVDGFYTSGGQTARIGRMAYTVSENFDQWILFNKGGSHGFLSIEPQCGAVNCLNSGHGLRVLAPGQAETFCTRIHPAE